MAQDKRDLRELNPDLPNLPSHRPTMHISGPIPGHSDLGNDVEDCDPGPMAVDEEKEKPEELAAPGTPRRFSQDLTGEDHTPEPVH